jgi:hypothetical protein
VPERLFAFTPLLREMFVDLAYRVVSAMWDDDDDDDDDDKNNHDDDDNDDEAGGCGEGRERLMTFKKSVGAL